MPRLIPRSSWNRRAATRVALSRSNYYVKVGTRVIYVIRNLVTLTRVATLPKRPRAFARDSIGSPELSWRTRRTRRRVSRSDPRGCHGASGSRRTTIGYDTVCPSNEFSEGTSNARWNAVRIVVASSDEPRGGASLQSHSG